MNKVLNINLGGYPFTIDDDGFEHLEHYLDTIHNHFKKSEGYEEITSDIETRMAELFQEKLNGRSIVTIRDVETCIAIMGTPEEFGAEPLEEEEVFEKTTHRKQQHNYKTGRRLFRDPDDSVVGGVCSGVSAYFGVEDPVWIRLLFVVGFVSGTIGLWIYIILWVILPEAKTSGDRLAMKGEPINVSNIGKIVEEEIEHFSDKLEDFGSELGSKKKRVAEKMAQEAPLRSGFLW